IKNAKKLFSTDLSLYNIDAFMMMIMAPKLNEYLKLRLNGDVVDYFEGLSMEIVNKKREELKNRGSFGKANNFIELLLEAEIEQRHEDDSNGVHNGHDADRIGKKSAQCNPLWGM